MCSTARGREFCRLKDDALARRRRRRPDGSENFDETEEDEDLDIRVTSVEEEIQNLAVSTLSQTQQMTALRARLDKLARELEEGNDGDDELFQEIDGIKNIIAELNLGDAAVPGKSEPDGGRYNSALIERRVPGIFQALSCRENSTEWCAHVFAKNIGDTEA